MKKVIYYDNSLEDDHQTSFRQHGAAVCIDPDKWYVDARFNEPTYRFTTNSYIAFIKYEIHEIWHELPIDMGGLRPFDTYEETTLQPGTLKEASRRLDKVIPLLLNNKGKDFVWSHNATTEWRIVIDNKECAREMERLSAFLKHSSTNPKNAVEFWL